MSVIVIEIDAVRCTRKLRNEAGVLEDRELQMNADAFFRPLQRTVRGKFDFSRALDPHARMKSFDLPPIPGQRLALDLKSKQGKLIEPLRDEAHEAVLRRIKAFLAKQAVSVPVRADLPLADALGLEVAEQTWDLSQQRLTTPYDVPTWCYWMHHLVKGGHGRLVSGEFPKKLEGQPTKRFDGQDRRVDPVVEMQRQERAYRYAMMSDTQRAAYDKMMAELREEDKHFKL